MAKVPATKLSLEYLRLQGMIADIVERHIPSKPFPKKHDLFNLFDIVAVDGGFDRNGIHFVQTTSASNRASRRKKMVENAEVMYAIERCREAHIELHSWKKVKGRYEVCVERCHIEYPGGGLPDKVIMLKCAAPTMASLRAKKRPSRM